MSRPGKGHRRTIVKRIIITAFFLTIQIWWLISSFFALTKNSVEIDALLRLLSLIAVMYIVCKDENPSYRLIWLILMLAFPIFGGLLYIFAGDKKPSKRMNKRIDATKKKYLPELDKGEDILENIRSEDRRAYATCKYIRDLSGYAPHGNTRVKYYPVGEKMYADMLTELKKAEHFIFLEYFIVSEGIMWNTIAKTLIEKAQSGVDVRIIYDDMGCVALLPPKYYKKLESICPNIKCLAFNPVVPVLSMVMNNRDHRKIMIIDGHTAFNGGINISDEYINKTHPYGHWKDTGVMLKGSAAVNFTEMFLELWHTFRDTDAQPDMSAYAPDKYAPLPEGDGFVQPFYDTPLDSEALSENVYIDIVNQAERYVYIFTPYLILDDCMKSALCLAAKRGVDVRIVTPGIPDKKPIFRLTRANYKPLLNAGVRIFEYSPGFIHAKSFVCDDKTGVVGTINLDYRSLFLHFECGTLLYNCDAVSDLRDDHLETMEKCREITADNIGNYYKGTMFDALLRIVAPLL